MMGARIKEEPQADSAVLKVKETCALARMLSHQTVPPWS